MDAATTNVLRLECATFSLGILKLTRAISYSARFFAYNINNLSVRSSMETKDIATPIKLIWLFCN